MIALDRTPNLHQSSVMLLTLGMWILLGSSQVMAKTSFLLPMGNDTAWVQASSEASPDSFALENAFDGDDRTAWSASATDTAPWVELRFAKPFYLRGISLLVGHRKNFLTFLRHPGPSILWISYDSTPAYRQLEIYRPDDRTNISTSSGVTRFVHDGWVDRILSERMVVADSGLVRSVRIILAAHEDPVISQIHLVAQESGEDPEFPLALRQLLSDSGISAVRRMRPDVQDLRKVRMRVKMDRRCPSDGEGECRTKDTIVSLLPSSQPAGIFYDNFWSLAYKTLPQSTEFRFLPGASTWEAILDPIPWQVQLETDPSANQIYRRPQSPIVADRLGSGEPLWESSVVIRGDLHGKITRIGTDSLDGMLEEGRLPTWNQPEWKHLNSAKQTSAIDTAPPLVDTTSVRIGRQIWMKKNLSSSTVDRSSLCWGMKLSDTGKWNRNCFEYGRLYRIREGLQACPKGWHLPTTEEWRELFETTGALEGSGYVLMAPGRWANPRPGMDPFGFSAKMVGTPPSLRPARYSPFTGHPDLTGPEFLSATCSYSTEDASDEGVVPVDVQRWRGERSFASHRIPLLKEPMSLLCSGAPSPWPACSTDPKTVYHPPDEYLPIRCIKNKSPTK